MKPLSSLSVSLPLLLHRYLHLCLCSRGLPEEAWGLQGPPHMRAHVPQAQRHSGRVSLLSVTAVSPTHSAVNWQSERRGLVRALTQAPCATPGNSLPLSEPQSPYLEKGGGAEGCPPSFPGGQRGNMELWFANSKAWGIRGGHL